MGLRMTIDMCIQKKRRTLLVVDSDKSTRKMLERLFSSKFEEVFTAKSFVEAIRITREIEITHLVSGFVFEKDEVNGFEIAAYLGSSKASISLVVVYTGTDISDLTVPPEIDAVVFKPGIEELTDVLLT